MTDIEYAHQQSEIFQFWKDDEMKMFEKLQELNKQYLEESKAYQKNICDTNFRVGSQAGAIDRIGMSYSDMLFWFMLIMNCFNIGSNNEPHTENEKTAFLNGKISAYEKMLRECE